MVERDDLTFERGIHKFLNFSTDPQKWYSLVTVQTKGENGKTRITADYKTATNEDDSYIDVYFIKEIDNLEIAISRNEFLPVVIEGYVNKTIVAQTKYFLRSLAKAIIFFNLILFPCIITSSSCW